MPYRGFVIEEKVRGFYYVRRPGSFLECVWAGHPRSIDDAKAAIDDLAVHLTTPPASAGTIKRRQPEKERTMPDDPHNAQEHPRSRLIANTVLAAIGFALALVLALAIPA